MHKTFHKSRLINKIINVIVSICFVIPTTAFASPKPTNNSYLLENQTLAPRSLSFITKIELQKTFNKAYQAGNLITDNQNYDFVMGFEHMDVNADCLKDEGVETIDFSQFFEKDKLEQGDSVKFIVFSGIPMGLALYSKEGNLIETATWEVLETDINVDEDIFKYMLSDYEFYVKEQTMPFDERNIVGITELEDTEEGVLVAGGKGASLGELEKAMLSISIERGETLSGVEGFVLSVAALRHFFNSNPEMKKEVQRLVYEVDTQNATEREKTATIIEKLIRGYDDKYKATIPEDIRLSITRYYSTLNTWMAIKDLGMGASLHELSVAIRSSGTAEDSKVDVPWYKNSTGSEAGIGETALGVTGLGSIFEKVQRGWSSLLTDRAFSYREFQALISCAGEIGEANYNYIIQKMKVREEEASNRGDIDYADRLKAGYTLLNEHSNMGYKRLVEFIETEIALLDVSTDEGKDAKDILQKIIDSYKKSASEVMDLDKLGQALVILRQLDSNCSGTSFTCITNTGFTGSHLKFNWDEKAGRVMALELDIAGQQGEAVVSSLTNPDHYELVRARKNNASADDVDPYQWIVTSKILGSKEIQVVLKDRLFTKEQDKKNKEKSSCGALDLILDSDNDTNKNLVMELSHSINLSLSGLSAQILIGKDFNWLYERLYNKDAKHTEKTILEYLEKYKKFDFNNDENITKLNKKDLQKAEKSLEKIIEILKKSSESTQTGIYDVKRKLFDKETNSDNTRVFLTIMGKIWKKEVLNESEISFLSKINMTPMQANKIAMMGHPEWDDRMTVAVATTKNVQENFVLEDAAVKQIANYLAGIGEHYAKKHGELDKRDLEWAIELSEDGSIEMKGIGIQGISRKGNGKFSPLQARPVTSKIVDGSPFVQLESTEVDANYIKTNKIESIAKGVKGVGAAVGDYLYFVDDENPLGEQEDEIRELVKQGKKVIAVIEFGGPQHDPIMKAANGGVITSQGGGTSHVAIFCREQGIVAVTGLGSDHTGKSRVEILQERQKQEGDNFKITIDANNGVIYGQDLPINNIYTEIKVPYLPKLQNTKVGLILGSPVKAQKLSKLADYESAYGISLARGEFIAEQMGLHPKAARCYGITRLLERSKYFDSIKDKLKNFEMKNLKNFEKYLKDNPYLADKFEALRIENIKPENLPNNIGTHSKLYEQYLMMIDLKEMKFINTTYQEIKLSEEDLDDLDRYAKWTVEYPDEYQQMLELVRGYNNPEDYVSLAMSGPQSAIALALGVNQVNQNRLFDNKPNEDDSKGAKVFTPRIWKGQKLTKSQKKNPFNNPLISLRGISLLNRQEEYDLLLEGLFKSVKNGVKNQGVMNVFIRTPREIRLFLEKMEKMAEKYGVMPSEVGLMTEVPSNYFYAPEMSMLLNAFYAKNSKKYGLKKVYFSFGTNDLTNLSGATDRDDPKIQNFVIKDTWVIDAPKAALNRLPDEAKELMIQNKDEKNNTMKTIALADESSPVLKRIMQAIIAEAKNPKNAAFQIILEAAKKLNKHPLEVTVQDLFDLEFYGIFVGLCGQAIVKGIEGGTIAETQELIFLLDSFGTDDKNYAQSAMTAYDAEQRFAELENKDDLKEIKNTELANLPDQGALTGSIVRISKKEDIRSKEFDHLKKAEDKNKALLQDPMKGTKVATKIVIVDGPLGSEKDFAEIVNETTGEVTQKATSWEDLRYAKAIFIDNTYWTTKGVFNEEQMKNDLSILFDNEKLKHRIKGVGSLTKEIVKDGQTVAFSYEDKKMYEGNDALIKYLKPEHTSIEIPDVNINEIEKIEGISFSTADVLNANNTHPLKVWNQKGAKAEKYYINEFIEAFKAQVTDKNQEVLWKAETLDRAQLWDKKSGEQMEESLNENPRLGIRDAARLLTDFEGINHAQLKAMEKLVKEGYKINYQITNLKGMRSKEVLSASLLAMNKLNFKKYKNFRVGVNIATLSDIVQAEEYLEWLDYLHVDYEDLAYSLLALDPVAQKSIKYGVIKDDEVLAMMTRPLKIILKALKDANKPLFINGQKEIDDLEIIKERDEFQKSQKKAAQVLKESAFYLLSQDKEIYSDISEKLFSLSFLFNSLTYRSIYDQDSLEEIRNFLANRDNGISMKNVDLKNTINFLDKEINKDIPATEIEEASKKVKKTYILSSISNILVRGLNNIKKCKATEISA